MPWSRFSGWSWAASIASGLLLVCSFAPFSCSSLAWIALVPAWWALSRSPRVARFPLRHGYLLGLLLFGGLFWWISNVTVPGTIFLILYLAFYPAVWFWLVTRCVGPSTKPRRPVFAAVGAASLWVMLEWWRGWFLTGFNWNELGVTQAPSLVYRQLAAFGGVPLLSWVLLFVNVLWAESLADLLPVLTRTKGQPLRIQGTGPTRLIGTPFMIALMTVTLGFALGWQHLGRHRGEITLVPLTYACVQPNIPQIPFNGSYTAFMATQQTALDRQVVLTQQALRPGAPELLVWPEAVIDEGVFSDRPLNEAVRGITREFRGGFLLGSQDLQGKNKLYNCAYLFTDGGDRYQEYLKTRLVVLGEYIPFAQQAPWLHEKLGVGLDFTPGTEAKCFLLANSPLSFAPLICFEDTLPEVASRASRLKSRPDFFVTITNDGWYQGWFAQWGLRQHLANAIFRCVEQDRTMLRCANNGISCEIDANGTVTRRLTDRAGHDVDVGGVFAGTLRIYRPGETPYARAGDWIVLLSGAIVVILGIFFLLRAPRA